jgi:hypothetical protein
MIAPYMESVAKVGYFCTALAVSQGFALRNGRFSNGRFSNGRFSNGRFSNVHF